MKFFVISSMTLSENSEGVYEFTCEIREDRYSIRTTNEDIIHSIYETTDLVNALRDRNILFVKNEMMVEVSDTYSLRDVVVAIREELGKVRVIVS